MSEDTTTQTPAPEPRRLKRSSSDRVLGGVCGGLGAYLGVDPIIVRVVAVVLAFFGGAGILFYLAAWLLVPSDDPTAGPAPGRAATIAGVVVLVLAAVTLLPLHRGRWGWGARGHRPASAAALRDHYRVGVGRLVVALRDANLPPGDHRLRVEAGVGQVLVLVPSDVCVSSKAHVGVGATEVFQRENGGADVDWQDERDAPRGTPRLIVDGDVGLGDFQVGERERRDHGFDEGAGVGTNAARAAARRGEAAP